MQKVVARIKLKGKRFEINVDLEEALKVKSGKGDINSALLCTNIYSDIKKGQVASQKDLMDSFGTEDIYEIAKKIIMSGEVQKTQEFRDSEREAKINQIIDLLLRTAVDQNGRPYTEERLRRAIEEVHYSFTDKSPEEQLNDLINKLKTIIPIRVEVKKVQLTIPARFTGKVYSLLKDFKESEEWLSNGDLKVILKIPAGMLLDFYDKLNHLTHGSIQSEEIKEQP